MLIRQGTVKEMLSLWYKKNTSEFFIGKINSCETEFWTIEHENKLIGELYFFKSLADRQFADGSTTAYLCAFRILDGFRRNGYGTKLMNTVLERIKTLGYKQVTIGVENSEPANIRFYKRMGFTEVIKICNNDPCDVNEDFTPICCSEYVLLRKVFL